MSREITTISINQTTDTKSVSLNVSLDGTDQTWVQLTEEFLLLLKGLGYELPDVDALVGGLEDVAEEEFGAFVRSN